MSEQKYQSVYFDKTPPTVSVTTPERLMHKAVERDDAGKADSCGPCKTEKRYPLSARRTLACKLLGLMPPAWREPVAESLLRRKSSPGPAAEHVIQHLLSHMHHRRKSRNNREAGVSKAADLFYANQYRQYLNPEMSAFAATAVQVLAASGGEPTGRLWRRHRHTHAAMLEDFGGAKPILVLSHQTVAVALFLPIAKRSGEGRAVMNWLSGKQAMPDYYRSLVSGGMSSPESRRYRILERSRDGAMLALAHAALASRRLALLAMHPYDADAMALHVTLFGVEALSVEQLRNDYGLGDACLEAYQSHALQSGRQLVFLVGGTEEAFTQCSQNLFVKTPAQDLSSEAVDYRHTELAVEDWLEKQFESLQITVSAGGLPGVSPRNGDVGRAVFAAPRNGRLCLLIPYHPGNAVHGHAAKLWSNPYSTLAVIDDHGDLCSMMFSGRSRIAFQDEVKKRFPEIADRVAGQTGRNGKTLDDPEYWFLQEVERIVRQAEAPAAHRLSPLRATCGIAAGGQALYNKKPGYFAAESLPAYDQALQHHREAAGRPLDPDGDEYATWQKNMQAALSARLAHLAEQATS